MPIARDDFFEDDPLNPRGRERARVSRDPGYLNDADRVGAFTLLASLLETGAMEFPSAARLVADALDDGGRSAAAERLRSFLDDVEVSRRATSDDDVSLVRSLRDRAVHWFGKEFVGQDEGLLLGALSVSETPERTLRAAAAAIPQRSRR